MGSHYKQKNSKIWWIKFYVNGRAIRESTGTEGETEADKILKLHEGQVAQGKRINPQTVKLEEIARAFLVDYQINDRKSIDKAIRSVCHLLKFFGNIKVQDITTDKINLFIQGRREDGVSNAEINRETAALKRMFNLAIRAEKVFSKPYIRS